MPSYEELLAAMRNLQPQREPARTQAPPFRQTTRPAPVPVEDYDSSTPASVINRMRESMNTEGLFVLENQPVRNAPAQAQRNPLAGQWSEAYQNAQQDRERVAQQQLADESQRYATRTQNYNIPQHGHTDVNTRLRQLEEENRLLAQQLENRRLQAMLQASQAAPAPYVTREPSFEAPFVDDSAPQQPPRRPAPASGQGNPLGSLQQGLSEALQRIRAGKGYVDDGGRHKYYAPGETSAPPKSVQAAISRAESMAATGWTPSFGGDIPTSEMVEAAPIAEGVYRAKLESPLEMRQRLLEQRILESAPAQSQLTESGRDTGSLDLGDLAAFALGE